MPFKARKYCYKMEQYQEYKDKDYYVFGEFRQEENIWISKRRVPEENVLKLMTSLREFIKLNDMPFGVFPISGGRICVRNKADILETKDRVLYKSILKSAELTRISNPITDPKALCYYFYERDCDDVIDVSFEINKIRDIFNKYSEKCKNIEWNDNLIKYQ